MFGDWRWGEHVAGAKGRVLFFFVRMLPSWHGGSGGWWLVSADDDKRGCWLFCSERWDAARCSSPGDVVCKQLVQTLVLLLAVAVKVGDSPSGGTWPHWWYCYYLSTVELWWFLLGVYVQTNGLAVLDSRWSNSCSSFWNGSYGS